MLFNDQLAFMAFIPESLRSSCFLPLPTLPKSWFVEKPSFCPASFKEHAAFMVQILNCLQFQNQKFIFKKHVLISVRGVISIFSTMSSEISMNMLFMNCLIL